MSASSVQGSLAYLLALEGKSVVVVDEGPVGIGQTGRTSAHLAYQSHATAIDTIEQISQDERIACDFARINAFLSAAEAQSENVLDEELEAATRAGFKDAEKLPNGGLGGKPCLRFGEQARFQPLRYLVGLAEAFKRRGGKIYSGQRVQDVQGADPKKKTPAKAKLGGRITITADHIVVATNTPSPINDWFGIYTEQASYRTYVIGASIPKRSVPDALYWDSGDPYHYVRIQRSPRGATDLLLIGGEDHKTGQIPNGAAPFMRLESWARPLFPKMGRVRYRWSGQCQEPADGLTVC